MTGRTPTTPVLTPQLIVSAYVQGAFPMARGRASEEVYFFSPDPRGVLPLDRFRIPRTVERIVRQNRFEIRHDTAFEQVIEGCAAPRTTDDGETWINDSIRGVYVELHALGIAHSIECWRDGVLAGGLYGVALGGAFFGESMFHHPDPRVGTHASNVALVATVNHLIARRFELFDVQYANEHIERFGVTEIPLETYLEHLDKALRLQRTWGNSNRSV
jgi:leucyl/phenylalanyl-tRNA--protein transferase